MKQPSNPAGCVGVDEHERELTSIATKLQATALEMIGSDGRIDVATGKELALAAIRARIAASRLASERAEREHYDRLAAEYKRIQQQQQHSVRPRLVRSVG